MKIRFIKEYRAYSWLDGSLETYDVYKSGETEKVSEDEAQWLIDNGFAEKVKESSLWEPKYGEEYYYLDGRGVVTGSDWECTAFDTCRRDIGNVFKTCDAAERYSGYLEAIETVRHDEGFMKISRKIDYDTYGYAISHSDWNKSLIAEKVESINHAGQFYFDTSEHAEASLDKHRYEWRTILDYDWSKE